MADPRPGKMTLLEIVQNVLSAMNSDEVNSFGDTVEAVQVADLVKETYYFLIANRNDLHRSNSFRLDSVSDVNRPNYLKLPASVKDVEKMYYDKQTDSKVTWYEVKYITPEEFILNSVNNSTNTAAQAVEDFTGATYYILNDSDPTYYTSFDDEYAVFDSWDDSKEATLQEHKSLCLGSVMPSFTMEDTAIPDLPADMFPLLLSEVKKIAFVNLKSASNSEEQLRSRRLRWQMQNDRSRAKRKRAGGVDYGRKAP